MEKSSPSFSRFTYYSSTIGGLGDLFMVGFFMESDSDICISSKEKNLFTKSTFLGDLVIEKRLKVDSLVSNQMKPSSWPFILLTR